MRTEHRKKLTDRDLKAAGISKNTVVRRVRKLKPKTGETSDKA